MSKQNVAKHTLTATRGLWHTLIEHITPLSEREMTDTEKKERERLVKGMKKTKDEFETRYPGRGKDVMYATATKRAMGEDAMSTSPDLSSSVVSPEMPVHRRDSYYHAPRVTVINQQTTDDDDQSMILAQLDAIASRAAKLHQTLGQVSLNDVPAWIQDKVSVADHNMSAILDYYMFETATLTEAERTMTTREVAWFLQPAHLIAKMLNGTDYSPVGIKPESIVNNAITNFLQTSHTTETWKAAGAALSAARTIAGIDWDISLIKPAIQQAMGITVADTAPKQEPSEKEPTRDKTDEKPEPQQTKDVPPTTEKEAAPKSGDTKDAPMASSKKSPEKETVGESMEIEIKLGKPLDQVTFQQKRQAALDFAATTCPSMIPNGVTPEQIVNNAISVWFHTHPVPLDAELAVLGDALEVLSKLGIDWNFQLVPPMYLNLLKLPDVKVITVDAKDTSAAGKTIDKLDDILIKL